jgi:hypothetical protein
MRIAIELGSYLVGLPLEVLIIAALLRGAYRRFPFVFAYAVASFLASAVELPLWVMSNLDKGSRILYVRTYWIAEQILLPLIYAVVISLIYESSISLRSRRMVRTLVIVGALLFAGITFLIHFDGKIGVGQWMTPWTQKLNFGAAILDLGLWAMLIGSRKKDQRVLILSGALGIQFTGEAIGESFRNMAQARHIRWLSYSASLWIVATNIIFLYMWWQAFRQAAPRKTPPAAAPVESERSASIKAEVNIKEPPRFSTAAAQWLGLMRGGKAYCLASARLAESVPPLLAFSPAVTASALKTFTSTRRFFARASRFLASSSGLS